MRTTLWGCLTCLTAGNLSSSNVCYHFLKHSCLIFDKKCSAYKDKQRIDIQENSKSRKRPRPNSNSKSEEKKQSRPPRKPLEFETDISILGRRQKQIDYGKNTVGYYNYTKQVPIELRNKDHPKTPDKYAKYSRRSWDSLIKIWRKQLHEYDDTGAPIKTETSESGSDNEELSKNSD